MIEKTVSHGIISTYFSKLERNLDLDVAIVGGGPSGIVAAYYLAKAGIKIRKGDGKMILAMALRLVLVPLICMFVLRAVGIAGDDLTACVIPASAPVAALVMMMAAKYSDNAEQASRLVSMSHLLSVITMPVLLTLCKYIGG